MLQERGPLPGPETGLLSNTRKLIVQGDTCADKAIDFIGKGGPCGEQGDKGTQENISVTWLAVSGFMVMGLVSGLSLASHSDSKSFLVGLVQPKWMPERRILGGVVFPFELSRTVPVGGALLVPCSSPEPPVVKLM